MEAVLPCKMRWNILYEVETASASIVDQCSHATLLLQASFDDPYAIMGDITDIKQAPTG